jgi:hypothetical protein
MPQNTSPIFPLIPSVQWGLTPITTANTALDGTGTVMTIFTANENGSRLDRIRMRSAGTNVATVIRFFINNGSSNATPANNILWYEQTLAASTASAVATLADNIYLPNLSLPAGYKLNIAIGTTVSAGYYVSCEGGHY